MLRCSVVWAEPGVTFFSLAAQALPNSQQMNTEAILSARKQEISGAEANMNGYRA